MNNSRFILIVFLVCLFFNCTCTIQGYENDLLQKIGKFISQQGFKVLVSPAFLKAQILTILRRVIPKALARSAAKNTPVLGIFTGIGFGVWRLVKGQPYRAIGQVTSGVLGATGIGIGGSLAIDITLLMSDIVAELMEKRFIKQGSIK